MDAESREIEYTALRQQLERAIELRGLNRDESGVAPAREALDAFVFALLREPGESPALIFATGYAKALHERAALEGAVPSELERDAIGALSAGGRLLRERLERLDDEDPTYTSDPDATVEVPVDVLRAVLNLAEADAANRLRIAPIADE